MPKQRKDAFRTASKLHFSVSFGELLAGFGNAEKLTVMFYLEVVAGRMVAVRFCGKKGRKRGFFARNYARAKERFCGLDAEVQRVVECEMISHC